MVIVQRVDGLLLQTENKTFAELNGAQVTPTHLSITLLLAQVHVRDQGLHRAGRCDIITVSTEGVSVRDGLCVAWTTQHIMLELPNLVINRIISGSKYQSIVYKVHVYVCIMYKRKKGMQ